MISLHFILPLLLTISVFSTTNATFSFRKATNSDVSEARKILFSEKMNPLSITREKLVVAYDENGDMPASDRQQLIGFGQIRPLGRSNAPDSNDGSADKDLNYEELASLFVRPEFRKQGIGSALVSELLRQYDEQNPIKNAAGDEVLCLLTLGTTVEFYERHGFRLIKEKDMIPPPLAFEYMAGSALSLFLGNSLVCMVRD